MKRNASLLLGILIALEDSQYEEVTTTDIKNDVNETTKTAYSVSEVKHHVYLLRDRGLVASSDRGHRLTDAGHDYLEAARQKVD